MGAFWHLPPLWSTILSHWPTNPSSASGHNSETDSLQQCIIDQAKSKTLLDWVRPPPLSAEKSKKISVFSVKEILDSARPPSPPFGVFLKKTSIFF